MDDCPIVVHVAFALAVMAALVPFLEGASAPPEGPAGSTSQATGQKWFYLVFMLVFTLAFPFLAWTGRSWARTGYAVLSAMGLLVILLVDAWVADVIDLRPSWDLFWFVVEFVPVFLFFAPAANRWYRERSSPRFGV